ncbi:J domain-containing protein [Helicobacter cappadocius]|uniref:J domain-containing protein n=1 Tax=Helicobacter cappadocius TaxID=3063998 RepID=A0AA90T9U9_9HELI|nr:MULTISPECIES: J domain-containing protein [unclassified Helicobacter]MDO7253343.1 J domain-containing protein [Helicobacter sp. faydin-H75]MDP2539227.1 J domain-containing protein [Helicobacter sp. faydin-H76]
MNVSYCNRYIQIELFQESELFEKIMRYSSKYFSEHYRLSSSILILDDGERFKKDYLINWAYHASLEEEKSHLDAVLLHTHLPIRIKILKKNDVLQKVKVSLRVVGLDKVILTLEKKNALARRYLKNLFGVYCDFECENEIHLKARGDEFWEHIMNLISSKIIHNVAIDFDYKGFFGKKFDSSFLTEDECNLRGYYLELESRFDDDFQSVKKRYLSLARTYHPDNVYGRDEAIVQDYHDRFTRINEAYEAIKKSQKIFLEV